MHSRKQRVRLLYQDLIARSRFSLHLTYCKLIRETFVVITAINIVLPSHFSRTKIATFVRTLPGKAKKQGYLRNPKHVPADRGMILCRGNIFAAESKFNSAKKWYPISCCLSRVIILAVVNSQHIRVHTYESWITGRDGCARRTGRNTINSSFSNYFLLKLGFTKQFAFIAAYLIIAVLRSDPREPDLAMSGDSARNKEKTDHPSWQDTFIERILMHLFSRLSNASIRTISEVLHFVRFTQPIRNVLVSYR